MHKNPAKDIQMSSKLLDLAIFGHPVINERINAIGIDRYGISSSLGKTIELLFLAKNAWNNQKNLEDIKNRVASIELTLGVEDTITDICSKIEKFLEEAVFIFKCHVQTSSTSVFYQMMEMNILLGGSKDITMEHYNDIAAILSSCDDVISAEVPATLEAIAKDLIVDRKMDEFTKVPPENGRVWLEKNCPRASKLFEKFIKDHGHRVLGEFDVAKRTWGQDPSTVIKMIQANSTISISKPRKQSSSVDDVIKLLVTPPNEFTRRILKFFMYRSKYAVGAREQSKSEAIRALHKLRLAYSELGTRMAHAGLIPAENLIFHLTHHEIKQVVKGGDDVPLLIGKAMKRKRFLEKWDKLKFSELNYGLPVAESANDVIVSEGSNVKCVGTPVCSGNVKARACVITSLEEIEQLKNGDILITYCTDIGWSPYFPMLSGIVTELGGLVSHGAVVAREYGLPSIVGAVNVTRLFKTGNVVILSGKSGTLELATP